MKKKVKLIIVLVAITLLLPIKASAVTLGEYEAAVEKYTKELQEKEAKIANDPHKQRYLIRILGLDIYKVNTINA